MKKSRVIRFLGPSETSVAPVEAPDFELCAAVDPRQSESLRPGAVPVYRDVLVALRRTRVSTVVYGNVYIDINGCDSLRSAVGQ